ncbi:MAG TPA: sn-glycerol-3-phosphate ABC transporter ATP-binding protein UgpC [Candidatus Tectomicrobia bacterium]|jgi:multiple sugar transport system ATP-binding protein|nr:sn-glycerol-3-phosphate ABC transporter ATP-binding protein UgpC [Candidatus Tectomicrobia bacterium]
MAQVVLRKVRKVYTGGYEAVKGIDLEIRDGEFMVLVGPSGCAKSTTLRMIAGLEDITSGDLFIGERRVNALPPSQRNVAMVFQDYALYPHMTVYENMAYGLRIRKLSKDDIHQRVTNAARILGLTEHLAQKPKALSGGQRQRVAVGRTLVREPEVFLFDEPLSNLDATLRVHMRAEIIKLQKTLATTMVYVTHDQVEAMTMGDRICVLDAGRIMQVETPRALYERPANRFVATFVGSPAMNILRGRLVHEHGVCRFVAGGMRLPLPSDKADRLTSYANRPVDLGIRPEHVLDGRAAADADTVVRGTVGLIELMGHELIAHVDVAGQPVIARLDAQAPVAPGAAHTFRFDMRYSHVFDPDSGATVSGEGVVN